MATMQLPRTRHMVLEEISWRTYSYLLRDLQNRRLQLTYDHGVLEIMTLSLEHERYGRFLGRLVITLTEELKVQVAEGGSLTLRRRRKERGLESDNCYWIQNEHLVRFKKTIDLRTDPPPDVAIEADVSRSSLNRMAIYASLKVPEGWRFDGTDLDFHILQSNGQYAMEDESRAFPGLRSKDLMPFLAMLEKRPANDVIDQFRGWIRRSFSKRQA